MTRHASSARSGVAAGLIAAAFVAVTVASAVSPDWLRLDAASIHAGVTTLAGVAVLLGAGVALARARRTGLECETRLAAAILIVALSSVFLGLLAAAGAAPDSAIATWLPVPSRLVGAGLLVSAARCGGARSSQPQHLAVAWLALLAAGMFAALTCVGLGLGVLADGPAPMILVSGLPTALFLIAGIGLAFRARASTDVALWWYAACAVALAQARLVFWLAPAPHDGWVSPGDLARVAAGAFLLLAARSELLERRARSQRRAVEEERERVAREIHDGLAQELAFIVGQTSRLAARSPDTNSLRQLSLAAQNALTDARRTILKMHNRSIRTLGSALVERTVQLSDRAGLALDLEMQGDLTVEPEEEHEILRIVSEAISNTARHAHASHVSISVSAEDGRVVLRIADDGDGFDPRVVRRRRGFGLAGMAQRAESLGGHLHLESQPGAGTVIELAI